MPAASTNERIAPVFPRARWIAMVWLLVWVACYWRVWGLANFLHLCNIAVILTCVGIWRGSSLLISSQAVSSLIAPLFWDLDVLWRLLLGKHLIGGTEYMWDFQFALAVRLLSLYHVPWPVLLLWALRRVRYDPRALPVQTTIAVVVLVISRYVQPALNLNFAHRDPFFGISLSPAILHLAVSAAVLIAVAYWPTHLLLMRLFPHFKNGANEHEDKALIADSATM
jgi:hypothetical protein